MDHVRFMVRRDFPAPGQFTTVLAPLCPETGAFLEQRGSVMAVGPGKLLECGKRGKLGLKKGDEVFYGKYSGTEVEIDDEKYVILRESDVLAVVG